MRYFFISYSALNNVNPNGHSIGNISFPSTVFPSKKKIIENILGVKDNGEVLTPTAIVITNIFEFKNEEDFNNFIKKD